MMCHVVWYAASDPACWGNHLEDDGWSSKAACQNNLSGEGRGRGVERFYIVSSQPLFDMP